MDQPYPCSSSSSSSVSHVEMAQRWLLGVCISNWLCTIPLTPPPLPLPTSILCGCVCAVCACLSAPFLSARTPRPFAPLHDCLSFCLLQYFLPICLYYLSIKPIVMLRSDTSTKSLLSIVWGNRFESKPRSKARVEYVFYFFLNPAQLYLLLVVSR